MIKLKHEPWCESHQWEPEDRAGTCDCGVGTHLELVPDLPDDDKDDENKIVPRA